MKLRLPLSLRSVLLRSFLVAGVSFAFQIHADTLTWKGGSGNLNDPNMWTNSLDADATFAPGDNGFINNGGTFEVDAGYTMDLGGGSLSFTTANGEGTLQGGGRITGAGTITIDIDAPRFSLRTNNLLSDFEGDIIVNSSGTGIFRLGSNSANDQDFGSGTLMMNGGFLRIEVSNDETSEILTTIRLTNGATIAAHAKNNVNLTNLEIGDGATDETVTYTGRGDGNESSGVGNTILNIYGELSGSSGSTFILNGTNRGGSTTTSTVKLHSANSYAGKLQVLGKDNTGSNTLELLHGDAAKYATVELQGGVAGANNAQARLSVGVDSATIGGLIGNANSVVTSTVASTLTVNNSADNIFDGVFEGNLSLIKTGAGSLTLTNTNHTHTGGTVAREGILKLAEARSAGSTLTIEQGGSVEMLGTGSGTYGLNSGITLNIAATGTGTSASLTGNLNFGGGELTLDVANLTAPGNSTPYFTINGDVTFTPDSLTKFSFTGDLAALAAGSYLFATANSIADFDASSWLFSTTGLTAYTYTLTTDGTNLILTIAERAGLNWTGATATPGTGIWTVDDGTGWEGGTAFTNGQTVVFGTLDAISDATVDIKGEVSPSTILVNGDTNYTFASTDTTGVIAGASTSLIKSGDSTLTIGIGNTYAGGTSVNEGTIIANAANALGTGNLTVDGGTLEANAANILGGTNTILLRNGVINANVADAFANKNILILAGILNANAALNTTQITLEGGTLSANATNVLGTGTILFAGGSLGFQADNFLSAIEIADGKTANLFVDNGYSATASFNTAATPILLTGSINKTGTGTLFLRPDTAATFTNKLVITEGSLGLDTVNGDITLNNSGGSFAGNLAITGGGSVFIDRNSFVNSTAGSIATVTSGSNLTFSSALGGNYDKNTVHLETGGELRFVDQSNRYWVENGFKVTGTGTIRFVSDAFSTVFASTNILSGFAGDIVLDGGLFRFGNAANNAGVNFNLGSGTVIVNAGGLFFAHTTNGSLVTKVRLNDGGILANGSDRNGFSLNNTLQIGDGSDTAVTAYIDATNDKCISTREDYITINGGLVGGDNANLILRGVYAARASGDPAIDDNRVSIVNLGGENTYSGVIQVQAHQGFWGNELHLTNALAAQYATIDLQGNLADYTGPGGTGNKVGKAILSIDAASATVAGLTGNTDSIVTSTVASTLTVNNSTDNTYNGVIDAGAGLSLVKTGTGSLTLGNANTYAGGTTLSQGTLIATNTTALGTGSVTLNAGTLQSEVSSLSTGSMTLNGGGISLDTTRLAAVGPNNATAFFVINGDLTFSSKTLFSFLGDASFGSGSYLFATANDIQGFDTFMYEFSPFREYDFSFTLNGSNELWLTVVGMDMAWHGDADGNGTWEVDQTGWDDGTVAFTNGKSVSFDTLDQSTDATIDISGTVEPEKIVVTGSTNYTFTSTDTTGVIAGTATLTKSGSGTLTIEIGNTYTEGTAIYAGILNANAANALGTGQVILEGGTLNANVANSLGTGNITVNGGNLNANVVDSLGTGDIALNGGSLSLNAAGDIISSGSTVLFNGGQLIYGAGADQDISAIIGGASTVNINTGTNNIIWSDASLNSIGLALAKSGDGNLDLILDGALTQTFTVSEGSASLNISTDSLDMSKLAGNGAFTLVNNTADSIGLNGTARLNSLILSSSGTNNAFTATDISGINTLRLDNVELTLDIADGSKSFSGNLIGSGTLAKLGAGTQILSLSNDAIDLEVREGTLRFNDNNRATAGNLHVYTGSTLTLGSDNPNDIADTVTLNTKDAHFHEGSTLNMIASNPTKGIASINASGDIYLPNQMTLNMVNYDTNQFTDDVLTLTIMTASGSYLSVGDASPIADGTAFGWNVAMNKSIDLFYDPFQILLVGDSLVARAGKKPTNELAAIANTPNSSAGANLLWAMGVPKTGTDMEKLLSSVMENYASGNNAQANNLMAASVGSTYMSVLSAQKADFRYQQNLIRNRMTAMGLNQGYTYKDELPLVNAWIQGNGFYDKLDSDGDAAGHDLNTWGGTVGFDMNITPSLTFGVAMTASYGDLNSSAGADSLTGSLDMYYVNLFAKYVHKRWTHSLILTGAWGEADVTRTVNYGSGAYSGSAKSDASAYGVFYELTHDLYLNREKTAIFQPIVNVGITSNSMNGFEEKSSGNAGINIDKFDQTTGTIGFGGRLLGTVGSNLFGREAIGELRALVVQDFGSNYATGNISYQTNPHFSERVRGAKVGKTGIQLGAGITVPVGLQSSIFADAAVDLRSRATSVYGSVGYRYNF